MKEKQSQKSSILLRSKIIFAVVIGLILLIPFMGLSNYWITFFVYCYFYAALGSAWNLIGGYGAQVSWCHAAFVCIGSYTSFIGYNTYSINPWICILLGMILCALTAFFIGFISFRLRGVFFSLSTIAFSEIVRLAVAWQKDFTGGYNGMYIIYRGSNFWNLTFKNDIPFYYISFGLVLIVTIISYWLKKSKYGYYLHAIRSDEDAALSIGIESYKVKSNVFILSAVLTCLIGSIYSFFITYIDPNSVGNLDLSTKIGAIAIVGGLGTVAGPIFGAFALFALSELSNKLFGTSGATMLPYGLALILVIMFRPNGISSFFIKNTNSPGGTSLIANIKNMLFSLPHKER